MSIDHVVEIGAFRGDPVNEVLIRRSGTERQGKRHVLIQLHSGPDLARLEDLRTRLGLRLSNYIPRGAYLEYLSDDVLDALAHEPAVRTVIEYPALAKIDPMLLRDRHDGEGRRRSSAIVTLFDEVEPEAVLGELASVGGGGAVEVLDDRALGGSVRVRLTLPNPEAVGVLASLRSVRWVEPVPEIVYDDLGAAATLQSGTPTGTLLWDAGVHGEGEIVGMLDDGPPDLSHCFFRDPDGTAPGPDHRKIVASRNASDTPVKEHPTIVAGLIAGDDLERPGASPHRGGAWAARLATGNSRDIPTRSTLLRELSSSAEVGATIHTNSWHRAPQGPGCPATYDSLSADTDQFCWADEDHLVLGSSGNSGEEQGPPGTAKNAVCVSASQTYPDQTVLGDGSSGPTADGRIKPDLMTVGCSVISARRGSGCRVTAPQSCASSWATPELAAGAALLRQYLREGRYPSGTPRDEDRRVPSGALLKAMLLASTAPAPDGRPPDPSRGWGVAELDHVLGDPAGMRHSCVWDLRHAEGLRHGETFTRLLVVTGDPEPLEITLVWTDPPGAEGVGSALVNELDLEVTGPEAPSAVPVVTDHGTVKRSVVVRPTAGSWVLSIRATGLRRHDIPQGFAVVAVGAVSPRSPAPSRE